MLDPNFMHSVVLMCRHSRKAPSANRHPARGVTLDVSHRPIACEGQRFPIFTCGPVGLVRCSSSTARRRDPGRRGDRTQTSSAARSTLATYLQEHAAVAPKRVRLLRRSTQAGVPGQLGEARDETRGGRRRSETDWVFGEDMQTTWRSI
jgi:hypothetical protein